MGFLLFIGILVVALLASLGTLFVMACIVIAANDYPGVGLLIIVVMTIIWMVVFYHWIG